MHSRHPEARDDQIRTGAEVLAEIDSDLFAQALPRAEWDHDAIMAAEESSKRARIEAIGKHLRENRPIVEFEGDLSDIDDLIADLRQMRRKARRNGGHHVTSRTHQHGGVVFHVNVPIVTRVKVEV